MASSKIDKENFSKEAHQLLEKLRSRRQGQNFLYLEQGSKNWGFQSTQNQMMTTMASGG